jgi:hypothetical protein
MPAWKQLKTLNKQMVCVLICKFYRNRQRRQDIICSLWYSESCSKPYMWIILLNSHSVCDVNVVLILTWVLLWINYEMSPPNSCVGGFVPNTTFRGGAFGKWLDHEGSDLIIGLIHWWIHNLVALLGVNGNWKGSRSLGACLWRVYLTFLTHSLSAFWLPWGKQHSSYHILPLWYFYLITILKLMEPASPALKPLKLRQTKSFLC